MNARHFLWCLTAILAAAFTHEARAQFSITPAAGYTIASIGSEGANFSAANPAPVPANLATGKTAFGSSNYPAPAHTIPNINDGLYGNSESWLADPSDAAPQIGINLANTQRISSFAFGRDNGNSTSEPQFTDRALGSYTIQITNTRSPGLATAVTGNANTGWVTVGTLNYTGDVDGVIGGGFTSYFRHQYSITQGGSPVAANAIRILPSSNSLAIDEVELTGTSAVTLLATGTHNVANVVPNNLALASNGATAFAKDVIGNGSFAPTHTIANLNDGLYGNQDSWIGNSLNSFAGVKLGQASIINSVAWGRDNGGEATAFTDRTLGDYILQYTTVSNPNELTPDSDWTTISVINYGAADPLSPSTRHLWGFDPVLATGVRLFAPGNGLGDGAAIDELEVFGTALPEPASIVLWSLMGVGVLFTSSRYLRRKS